TAES
ncbi:hypothetical protein AB1N83_011123, partial [Pleurotus pulmonarius]